MSICICIRGEQENKVRGCVVILSYHPHLVCTSFAYQSRTRGRGGDTPCSWTPSQYLPPFFISLSLSHPSLLPSQQLHRQFTFLCSNCLSPCDSIETNFFYPCLFIGVHCFSKCLLPSPSPLFYLSTHSLLPALPALSVVYVCLLSFTHLCH